MSGTGEHAATTLRRLEQRARKRFGQNFLVDERAVKRIVRFSGATADSRVVEIGPGLGALSRALLATGAQLRAVELDRDLAAFLAQELPELEVVQGDALKIPLDELAPGEGNLCCANLPYNVGTRILLRLLPEHPRFQRLVLMFQKEVAERIVAGPGSRTYGSLSVMAQAWSRPELGFILPPGAFHPRPKVHSAVVRFELLDAPRMGGCDPAHFEKVVRAGFSQRRKTLENALSNTFTKERSRAVVADTVGSRRRAETLALDEWGVLAAALAEPAG